MHQKLPEDLVARAERDLIAGQSFSDDPATQQNAEQFIASARSANDPDEVARRLGGLLALRPGDRSIHLDYMRALRDCRRFADAMDIARAGVERFPEDSVFAADGVFIALALNDPDAALALAHQTWAQEPGHPHAFSAMNRALLDSGRFEELQTFLQSLVGDHRYGEHARRGLERIREDSAIFFSNGIDKIAAAIDQRDWAAARRLIRSRATATFVEGLDMILGERALYLKLVFLTLRLRVAEELPDADTVAEARAFEAANRDAIAQFKRWAHEANALASFYFLLGRQPGLPVEDARLYFTLALACDDSFFPAQLWLNALERGLSPPALFSALGVPLARETWKYRLAAALLDLRPPAATQAAVDEDCAICIRGICDAATPLIVRYYRHHYPKSRIIVSVWDTTNPDWVAAMETYADRVLLQPDPKVPGYRNINRQIANAYCALAEAEAMGARYALLCRTDFLIFRPRLLEQLARVAEQGRRPGEAQGPIVVPDAYTRKWVPRHPADMIMFGRTEDVLGFWSVAWQTKLALDPPPHDAPPEIYFMRAYLDRCNRPGARHNQAEWLSALAELFIVRDFEWFEALWLKQPHFRGAQEQRMWSDCMSQADWETIGLSDDHSHTQYFSTREQTAFYDQILALPKF